MIRGSSSVRPGWRDGTRVRAERAPGGDPIVSETVEQLDGMREDTGKMSAGARCCDCFVGTVLGAGAGVTSQSGQRARSRKLRGIGKKCKRARTVAAVSVGMTAAAVAISEALARNSDCCQGGRQPIAICDVLVDASTCAPTDEPTRYCKEQTLLGGVHPSWQMR